MLHVTLTQSVEGGGGFYSHFPAQIWLKRIVEIPKSQWLFPFSFSIVVWAKNPSPSAWNFYFQHKIGNSKLPVIY